MIPRRHHIAETANYWRCSYRSAKWIEWISFSALWLLIILPLTYAYICFFIAIFNHFRGVDDNSSPFWFFNRYEANAERQERELSDKMIREAHRP